MKKLSIVISSYDDQKNPIYSGGGAYSVHMLAKRLSRKYEVTVITGTYEKAKNESIDGIKYVRIGSYLLGHKAGQLIYQYALLRYARRMDYDLWIESSTPPFTFSFLPLFCRKPVIIWINMLCSLDMQRKYKLKVFGVFERALSNFYRYVITPTDWVKKEIASLNTRAKIYTISQGFDPEFPDEDLKRMPGLGNYLLYMGRIEVNQKGLDLLLQAMYFTGSNTQLVIAGSGSKEEEKKLTDLIMYYGLVGRVKRIGRVEGKQKEILLKYAKGVVVPSRFETFSMTALESIMHQKPVICFDIPQLQWIPGKYAFKIKPYSLKQMAKSIDSVFLPNVKKKISRRDREEFLQKFSWSNTAAKFESVFRTLL